MLLGLALPHNLAPQVDAREPAALCKWQCGARVWAPPWAFSVSQGEHMSERPSGFNYLAPVGISGRCFLGAASEYAPWEGVLCQGP